VTTAATSRCRYEAEADALATYHLQRMGEAPLDMQPRIRSRRRAYLTALHHHEGALPVLLSLSEKHGMTPAFTRLVFGLVGQAGPVVSTAPGQPS